MGRIKGTIQLQDMAHVDFAVEAATENESLKLGIFKELDRICRKDVILSSNTSSLSITKIALCHAKTFAGDRHAFHEPGPVMQLVEIIRGLRTSQETYDTVKSLTEKMGKNPR